MIFMLLLANFVYDLNESTNDYHITFGVAKTQLQKDALYQMLDLCLSYFEVAHQRVEAPPRAGQTEGTNYANNQSTNTTN